MYCGNNKMALASQRQIADALLSMLEEMSYGDISVSAICKRADVSRQTFYSLFQSKDNVITFTLRNDCCYSADVQQSPCECEAAFRQVCGGFGRYIIQHANVLALLTRHDLMPLLRTVLREDFSKCPSLNVLYEPSLEPDVIDYLASGIASIAETYIRTGQSADPHQLEDIIYLLMHGKYYR